MKTKESGINVIGSTESTRIITFGETINELRSELNLVSDDDPGLKDAFLVWNEFLCGYYDDIDCDKTKTKMIIGVLDDDFKKLWVRSNHLLMKQIKSKSVQRLIIAVG